MYYLFAISFLVARFDSPIEQAFAQLALQTKSSSGRGESRLLDLAEMYVTKGVTPDELSVLNDKLKVLYHQKKYRECAAIGMKMAKMLPADASNYIFGLDSIEVSTGKPEKSLPKQIPTEYGTFLQAMWLTSVGDMLALDNDYKGALRIYDHVRMFRSTAKEKNLHPSLSGTDGAYYGDALVHTVLGHRTEALKFIQVAPHVDPSDCGNCQWGTERDADLLRAVYDAATLPGPSAEVALMQILKTGYKPGKLVYDDKASHEENVEIKVNAAFLLGEIYLRRGDKKLASSAFRSITGYPSSALAIMAKSRLRKLDSVGGTQ